MISEILGGTSLNLTLEEVEYLLIQILNRKMQLKKPIYELVDVEKKDLDELCKITQIEQKLIKYMKK